MCGQLQQRKRLFGVFDFDVPEHGHGQIDGYDGGHDQGWPINVKRSKRCEIGITTSNESKRPNPKLRVKERRRSDPNWCDIIIWFFDYCDCGCRYHKKKMRKRRELPARYLVLAVSASFVHENACRRPRQRRDAVDWRHCAVLKTPPPPRPRRSTVRPPAVATLPCYYRYYTPLFYYYYRILVFFLAAYCVARHVLRERKQ